MTHATVDGVAFHRICGGEISRGQVRVRQRLRPRLSSVSSEVELVSKVLVRVLSYYASRLGLSGGVPTHNDVGESLTRLRSC
jgi:hypothetical protein